MEINENRGDNMKTSDKMRDLTFKNMFILVTYIAILILGLIYFKSILKFINTLLSIATPFIIGFVLAFILNIPMNFFYEKLPMKDHKKKKRISALLSILSILLVIIIVVMIVLPQVISNIKMLIENIPAGLEQLEKWFTYFTNEIEIPVEMVEKFENFQNNFGQTLITKVTTWAPGIASKITSISASVVDVFVGIVMAIYMLLSKDTLMRQCRKLGQAVLSERHYIQVREIVQLTSETFQNFIAGQLTESLIIGVLCYIGCLILDIPYASIAALVIGFTNIIPYFGPIIGAFISSLLILFISPFKMVVFIIFSTILQQVESNLIYPHVVGGSIGLSALWVLFAVSIGGGLFGIPGMIFGLPTFSVIYELLRRWTNQRMKEKQREKEKLKDVTGTA